MAIICPIGFDIRPKVVLLQVTFTDMVNQFGEKLVMVKSLGKNIRPPCKNVLLKVIMVTLTFQVQLVTSSP